jgi:hypothetical protein
MVLLQRNLCLVKLLEEIDLVMMFVSVISVAPAERNSLYTVGVWANGSAFQTKVEPF